MVKSKTNSLPEENVRIPGELLKKLRVIAGEAQLRGEKAPKYGDLLAEAWEKASSSGETPTTVTKVENSAPSGLRSGAASETFAASRLLNSLEQSGRTDLLNIATAMLRVLVTEAESGGKGGEHSTGRQAGPGGQGVDLDRARRGVEAAQEHAERIIEEFGGSGRVAEKPGVPGKPRKRTGGAA